MIMASKVTMVRLSADGRTRSFEVSHAERLLRMPNNGGWHIAKGENVVLTENGFKSIKDKRGGSEAEQA